MKRVYAVLLSVIFPALLLFPVVRAEAPLTPWICARCGEAVLGHFCPSCAGTEEIPLKEGEWICVCGRVNTSNFCGRCGTGREAAAQAWADRRGAAADGRQELAAMRSAQAGDLVLYGRYPQTANGGDETPIEWLVLERKNDTLTLISRYGLDCLPYNDSPAPATWEDCTLRKWLNGEFLSTAFTDEELAAVLTVHRENGDNPYYGTPGGSDTDDRASLLSLDEVQMYFPLSEAPGKDWCPGVSEKLISPPTQYACGRGAGSAVLGDTDIARILQDYGVRLPDGVAGSPTGWWWLRSPGAGADRAMNVGSYCDIGAQGRSVDTAWFCVRPVICVRVPQG